MFHCSDKSKQETGSREKHKSSVPLSAASELDFLSRLQATGEDVSLVVIYINEVFSKW